MIGAFVVLAQLMIVAHASDTMPACSTARPIVIVQARLDTAPGVHLGPLAAPETVYVGQQINYQVAVFLNETAHDRLRRNPTFYPPDMPSTMAYDLPLAPTPRSALGRAGQCFQPLVYNRALFPLVAGRLVIPPAELSYALPVSTGFWSQEETHTVTTDSAVMVAVSPPRLGRPTDYTGAVGQLSLRAWLRGTPRVGEPITLTVRVTGSGNVRLFPRPALDVPWAAMVPGDDRVALDTGGVHIHGAKEFDWVLTPRTAGDVELPSIRYSYFDPVVRRYEVASTTPQRVSVAPGTLAVMDTLQRSRILALRTRYRGPVGLPPHDRPVFWVMLALVPLPALTLRWRHRPRKPPAPPSALGTLQALPRAPERNDPAAVRRVWVRALGARLGVDTAAFSRAEGLSHVLRRSGVSVDVAADAERFLRTLDEAAFSGRRPETSPSAARAVELYHAVDNEALPREEVRLPRALMAVLLVAGAAAAGRALAPNVGRAHFEAGVAAYSTGRYAAARDAFARTAALEPRDADAWANFGTAAWAAGDSARAVAGWQRALRLEPLAGDVRTRLALVRPEALSGPGAVPEVPLSLLGLLALVLWGTGWVMAAREARRGSPIGGRTAWLGVATFAAVLSALGLGDRLASHRVAVVGHDITLAAAPVLGAESRGAVGTGSVVRVLQREGVWSQIGRDGQDGWIPSDSLIRLDAPPQMGD